MTTVPGRAVGSSELAKGASFDTAFRPGGPGLLHVTCTAVGLPMTHPVELARSVAVFRPGTTTPIATVTAKAGDPFALDHTITAADLPMKGNWVCRVTNPTDSTKNLFTVTVTYPSAIPIRTATIDIGFVDGILGQALAAAAPAITFEGSAPGDHTERSSISFAAGFTLVKEYRFRVPDPTVLDHQVFHIPRSVVPLTALTVELATDTGVPALELTIAAAAVVLDGATIVSLAAIIGFDGSVTVKVAATSNVGTVDIGDTVAGAIQSGIDAKLGELRDPISKFLHTAFGRLCQLGPGGHVDGFRLTTTELAVDYHVDPIQPVVTPVPAPSPVLR